MTFSSPYLLLTLLAVPAAVVFYLWLERRRRRLGEAFASVPMLPNVVDRSPGWKRHVPGAILLLAVAAFLVGFARPHVDLSFSAEKATVVLAIDSSRSMQATDVKPTRLAAAQASARTFLEGLPKRYRVAVVAFSTTAQVVSAPTQDRAFVAEAIAGLRPSEATALGDAVSTSVKVATSITKGDRGSKQPPPAAILVVSDGALDGGRVGPDEAIAQARKAGVPVFTAVLGTEDGVVQVRLVGGYVERIRVPPNPALLRRFAEQTGGDFFKAPAKENLEAVYANLESRLGSTSKRTEVTVAFAAGAAILLLLAGGLSTVWFRRAP